MTDAGATRPEDARFEAWIAELLERAAAGELAPALERLCAEHPDDADRLRARVDRLMALGLVTGVGRSSSPGPEPPSAIGPYAIVQSLGRGGMGEVFLARQTEPVEREVALKVVQPGLASAHAVARFESERQTLARLNHDGIARVFDAGSTADGQPFFVMEFVAGAPITTFCDERAIDVDGRLRLFLKVCDAVQYAHQNGIVHRDLKPSNILVREQDGVAVAKVIDFGLAKAIDDRRDPDRPQLTEVGQIVGTPEYMSPEQADLDEPSIDTRTDVYSLGVLLYELLSGALPLESSWLRDKGFSEMQRVVRTVEPKRPSSRIAQAGDPAIAVRRRATTSVLVRRVRGDLDWIALKALAKDRDHRYASVSELAADVRRHLEHDTVLASPPSATYRIRKFVRRNRGVVVAAALLLASLLAGFVMFAVQYRIGERYLTMYDRAALADQVAALIVESDALWPAHPDRIPGFEEWLGRARPLAASLAELQADLAALREESGRQTEGGWHFEQGRLQILDDNMSALVADLRTLGTAGGVIEQVEGRLDWARTLHERTIDAPAARWRDASASIADESQCPLYRGLTIEPQLGLIPLRRDPATELWEFVFPQPGGTPPVERDDGALAVEPSTDLVMVLIPPGSVTVRGIAVELRPFFLSKYEVTQAQWERFTGSNPSRFAPPGSAEQPVGPTHPVEQVSWSDADRWTRRLVLALPTAAQWELAARAGTDTPWWTGAEPSSLAGGGGEGGEGAAANLADESARAAKSGAPAYEDGYDDGWPLHAPADTLRPNRFGLHHVLGNVWEWCRDDYFQAAAAAAPRKRDGLLVGDGGSTRIRVARGGSFYSTARRATVGFRLTSAPDQVNPGFGLRPSRPLRD